MRFRGSRCPRRFERNGEIEWNTTKEDGPWKRGGQEQTGDNDEDAATEEGEEEEEIRRGRVRRAWWTIHGCQKGSMASHTHLTLPSSESEQPYKVAGPRFNPKFISSISKSLSRRFEREGEADEDDAAFPSPRHPLRF